MTDPSVPVLEGPLRQPPDPDEFIRAAMEWHFSPETGSAYWLERADTLDFDPRTDVQGAADLTLFPNVADELRDVSARDLIPRGYGPRPQVAGAFESGGTTGAPKRVVLMQDWVDQCDAWIWARMDELGVPSDADWLSMAPTGPHAMGHAIARLVRSRGGIAHGIDLDPRWIRRIMSAGKTEEITGYFEHVIEQATDILRTQNVGVLATTPPLLERASVLDELAALIKDNVSVILWSGASMDSETRDLLRREVFPDTPLIGVYGNSMMLSAIYERANGAGDGRCVFDPPAPWIILSVVDPETNQAVPYGERGRLLVHHVSKSFLLPNNLERDVATRTLPPGGADSAVSDSIADVAPVAELDEAEAVVEGAY